MARYADIRKPAMVNDTVKVDNRDPYRRGWSGRLALMFILVLALVAIRLYQDRGSGVFGKLTNAGEAEPKTTPAPTFTPAPPSEIKTAPVDTPEVAVEVEEPPRVAAKPPRVVAARPPRVVAARPTRVVAARPTRVEPSRVAARPSRVPVELHRVATRPRRVAVESPVVSIERQPALTTEMQSDVLGYARIVAESANLRERPGIQYRLINVLPRNREVAVLRQLHIDTKGEAWVEVLAETDQGWRKGWVMRNFLNLCNCPNN